MWLVAPTVSSFIQSRTRWSKDAKLIQGKKKILKPLKLLILKKTHFYGLFEIL